MDDNIKMAVTAPALLFLIFLFLFLLLVILILKIRLEQIHINIDQDVQLDIEQQPCPTYYEAVLNPEREAEAPPPSYEEALNLEISIEH